MWRINWLLLGSIAPFLRAATPLQFDLSSEVHQGHELDAQELEQKWGSEWCFSGISTFAHLPHTRCLTSPEPRFDIGIIGVPFDTAVTYRTDQIALCTRIAALIESYLESSKPSPLESCSFRYIWLFGLSFEWRSGARFGPRAIRAASARQISFFGFNARASLNPYTSWASIVDCGDVPVMPFDNALALQQMSEAFLQLGSRSRPGTDFNILDNRGPHHRRPRLVTLGGDHSIALAALRALHHIYGQAIAVVHFDAHLDTWRPSKLRSFWNSSQSEFNHGSMFWKASQEGLILEGRSVHAGLRTRLTGDGWDDYDDDDRQGFLRISSDDIDDIGTKGVIDAIMKRVGEEVPTYLSVDIDVIDPGLAPGTGTPEPGGWTTRELIRILRGVERLNVVGADVVEVAPAYDTRGESTALAAAQVVYEVITSMVKRELSPSKSAKDDSKTEL